MTALDAECRRIGEARAAGFLTGAEAGMLTALACLLHDLGVVTPCPHEPPGSPAVTGCAAPRHGGQAGPTPTERTT